MGSVRPPPPWSATASPSPAAAAAATGYPELAAAGSDATTARLSPSAAPAAAAASVRTPSPPAAPAATAAASWPLGLAAAASGADKTAPPPSAGGPIGWADTSCRRSRRHGRSISTVKSVSLRTRLPLLPVTLREAVCVKLQKLEIHVR